MSSEIVVAALYKFVSLKDFKEIQPRLLEKCQEAGTKGTLLLAHEGINGTIAGSRGNIDIILSYLRSDERLADLDWKESYCEENPFYRMKVRLKKEIVTLGVPTVDPNRVVGTYVTPQDWNDIISDPETIVVDTRNDYEYEIGSFKGAHDPQTETFREFPDYIKKNLDPKKHKKVAMFCTGGIRCEKASAYMLDEGFEEVYHLKGGILKYLEEVPLEESLWEGDCFVFDGRVGVTHGLEVGEYDQCYGCRHPITEEGKASEKYMLGVCCPKCFDKTTDDQKKRFADRQYQMKLAKERGEKHIAR